MSFLERYQQFRDKQKFIERLKTNRKMSTTTIEKENKSTLTEQDHKVIEVIREVFEKMHLAYDDRSFELVAQIVKQCKQKSYSTFKAANVICEELDIESRCNVTAIEIALRTNNILY
jgi:sulfur relay (sulfurtransferase) DsrC/TusE family protein